jgi:hypothetical protein
MCRFLLLKLCVLSAHPHIFVACGVYRVVVVIQMGDDIRNCSYSSVVDNEGSWPLIMKFPHLYPVSEENIFILLMSSFRVVCVRTLRFVLQSPSPCNIWHDILILEHLKPNIPRIISPIFSQLLCFPASSWLLPDGVLRSSPLTPQLNVTLSADSARSGSRTHFLVHDHRLPPSRRNAD